MRYVINEQNKTVLEKEKEIPVVMKTGVIVAGGGPAGLGAAVAAARNGAEVLLIERNAFLGGVATAALMATFIIPPDHVTGFSKEIINKLISIKGAVGGPVIAFDPESFKQMALEIVEEAGAKLLLYTWVVDTLIENDKIKGVVIENKSGRQAVLADVVVDTTGDGDIAVRAGVPYAKGREQNGKMRPMTILFRMGGVDVKKLVEYAKEHPDQFTPDPNMQVLELEKGVVRISGFFDLIDKARARGEVDKDCHYLRLEGVQVDRGIVFVNTIRVYNVDGTDAWDLTKAELEARKQMQQLVKFITKYIPGCESAYVIDSSISIGVRETRRIKGKYILTEEDIAQDKTYPDTIARIWRRWTPGIEMHSPDAGEGSPSDLPSRTLVIPLRAFNIPYRCLLPQKIDGLLVAGRCMSTTHQADGWTRGMYCCMVTGQAAGTAAALALKEGVTPGKIDISKLQKMLIEQGVALQ